MSTTTKIIRAVMKKAKDNPEKLSTKAAKATVSSVKGAKKVIKDVSLDKADIAAGKAVESIAKGAKKVPGRWRECFCHASILILYRCRQSKKDR